MQRKLLTFVAIRCTATAVRINPGALYTRSSEPKANLNCDRALLVAVPRNDPEDLVGVRPGNISIKALVYKKDNCLRFGKASIAAVLNKNADSPS